MIYSLSLFPLHFKCFLLSIHKLFHLSQMQINNVHGWSSSISYHHFSPSLAVQLLDRPVLIKTNSSVQYYRIYISKFYIWHQSIGKPSLVSRVTLMRKLNCSGCSVWMICKGVGCGVVCMAKGYQRLARWWCHKYQIQEAFQTPTTAAGKEKYVKRQTLA